METNQKKRKAVSKSQQIEVDCDEGCPSDSEDDDYSPSETDSEDDDDDDCIDDELGDDGNLEYVDYSYEPFEDPLWGNHEVENDNESNYIQRLVQNGEMYVDRVHLCDRYTEGNYVKDGHKKGKE